MMDTLIDAKVLNKIKQDEFSSTLNGSCKDNSTNIINKCDMKVSTFNEALLTAVKMWKNPNIYDELKRKCDLVYIHMHAYIHRIEHFSAKKERYPVICHNIGIPEGHYAK